MSGKTTGRKKTNEFKIEAIKKLLEDYVANGGNVDNITSKDEIYRLIVNMHIKYPNEHEWSFAQKCEAVGHPRTVRGTRTPRDFSDENLYNKYIESCVAYLKSIIDPYVQAGGDVNDLAGDGEICRMVKNKPVRYRDRDADMSLEEKFALAGYPRMPKLNVYKNHTEYYLDKAKKYLHDMVSPYVEQGGDVNKLTSYDELYLKINGFVLKHPDGRAYRIAEKFELAGFPLSREAGARTETIDEKLHKAIQSYLDNGGEFNVISNELPFISTMNTGLKYMRKMTDNPRLSMREYLKSIGYNISSNAYKKYQEVFELKKYKDENGNVDAYVKDRHLWNKVGKLAKDLELPRDVIITLVADQNKSYYYLESNYYKEVSYLLAEYKSKFGDYNNIYINDIELAKKLQYVKTLLGDTDLTYKDIVEFLTEEQDVDIRRNIKRKDYNFNEIISGLKERASLKNGILTRSDISSSEIYYLTQEAYRQDTYVFELLNMCGIEYNGGRVRNRASLMKVQDFPYIDEMRKERDVLYKNFMESHSNAPAEQMFDTYLEICTQVYRKYESQITKQSEKDLERESSEEVLTI